MSKIKFLLVFGLSVFLLIVSSCSFLADDSAVDNPNVSQLQQVYTNLQHRYDAQKAYFDKNTYDEVGRKDLEETEKNLVFLQNILNDGYACTTADYRYDMLGFYFPWYKALKPIDRDGLVNATSGAMSEFCYSVLSDTALYSFKNVNEGKTSYSYYGYLPDSSYKQYKVVDYKGEATCSISTWSDDNFEWSCSYVADDGKKVTDRYSYDFVFEVGSLLSAGE